MKRVVVRGGLPFAAVAVLAAVAACTAPAERDVVMPSSTPAASVSVADSPEQLSPSPSPAPALGCRAGDPMSNVYHPNRFDILDECATVKGVVRSIRAEPDGDLHIDVDVNAAFKGMLNARNGSAQHGWLVVEIVPADRAGCPGAFPLAVAGYDYGQCTGANLVAPALGTYIQVTGPFALDRQHGWNEIHPVWRWVRLGAPAIAVAHGGGRCNPNYRGACLDKPGDYDCLGGGGDGPNYTGPVQVVGHDDYKLDRDGDGYACE